MEAYPSDSLLGSVVDRRYRIDERVGSGAFGCVYAAWHLSLGVRVALKVLTLDPDLSDGERGELVARFLNEARVLTHLKHPGIVAALDLGTVTLEPESAAVPYLVMEWCDGQTLKQLLSEQGALSLTDAYEIIEPLADALTHAHAAGVLHRDIKPTNVMLSTVLGRPSPRLIDFGIAKHSPPRDPNASSQSVTIGTPPYTAAYAAPEQVAGARTSPATDVHAMGLLFIELCTGAPPYGNGADPALAIIDATRPSAGASAGAFADVIERAVALKAADRYPDGRALRDALRDAARQELGATHPIPSARLANRPRRPLALALGIGAIVAGLIALTIWRAEPLPAPEVTSSAPVAPATLCELGEAEQRERLAATGLTVWDFDLGWALLGAGERVVTVEWGDGSSPEQTLAGAVTAINEIDSLGLAYAIDRGCLVYTRGPRAELSSNLDAVLAGGAPELRGDTRAGPDPLAIGRRGTPWQGPRAAHLREVSASEYVARAAAAGLLIHDANRVEKKNGDWFQLSFKRGSTRGRLEYISGPYARAQLLAKLGKAEGVVYYAIEEPVVILARGLSDPSLLDSMLSDLGAPVQKSPP